MQGIKSNRVPEMSFWWRTVVLQHKRFDRTITGSFTHRMIPAIYRNLLETAIAESLNMLSRRSILIVLLLIFSQSLVLAQTITPLSDRVGTLITADERAYFNLFHRFPDFKQASFTSASDDSLFFLEIVSSVNGNDVIQTDTLEAKVFYELSRYVTQFERLYDKTGQVKWGYIIPYAGPKRWNRKRAKAFVKLLDGNKYEGQLVFIDNQQLILYPGKQKVPYLPQANPLIIDPASIETVKVRYGLVQAILYGINDILFYSRTLYIFGNQDRYQKQVVPSLIGQSVFSNAYPPELDDARATPPVALLRPPLPAEELYLKRIDRLWTLKINAITSLSRSAQPIPFSSFDEDAGEYSVQLTNLTLQASLQKNITKRLALGGVLIYNPSFDVSSIDYFIPGSNIPLPAAQRESSRIDISGLTFTPTVSFKLAVTDKRRYALEREIALLDRFEIGLTVGPTLSAFTYNASISPRELGFLYTGFLVRVHAFSWDDFIIGGLGQVDLYFYPRENFSIGLTGEYVAIPFKSVDLATFDNPLQEGVNFEPRSFVAPSTLLEQFSLNVGFRIHF